LHKAIDSLAKTASGRLGRFPGTHEKFAWKTSHVIVYAKDDNAKTTTIVRIIHTSREWLDGCCRIRSLLVENTTDAIIGMIFALRIFRTT
jgi:hypothetical protein